MIFFILLLFSCFVNIFQTILTIFSKTTYNLFTIYFTFSILFSYQPSSIYKKTQRKTGPITLPFYPLRLGAQHFHAALVGGAIFNSLVIMVLPAFRFPQAFLPHQQSILYILQFLLLEFYPPLTFVMLSLSFLYLINLP